MIQNSPYPWRRRKWRSLAGTCLRPFLLRTRHGILQTCYKMRSTWGSVTYVCLRIDPGNTFFCTRIVSCLQYTQGHGDIFQLNLNRQPRALLLVYNIRMLSYHRETTQNDEHVRFNTMRATRIIIIAAVMLQVIPAGNISHQTSTKQQTNVRSAK